MYPKIKCGLATRFDKNISFNKFMDIMRSMELAIHKHIAKKEQDTGRYINMDDIQVRVDIDKIKMWCYHSFNNKDKNINIVDRTIAFDLAEG